MKKPLRSLTPAKRRELDHAVAILREEFAVATSTRKAPRLRDGRILKIILFGSYARGDWVHDPVGRYFSDFDLLVVVDHEDLTDFEFWEKAEKRLLADVTSGQMLRTPVSVIVHSLDDVNYKLEHGRSFFIDIVRDGVTLLNTPSVSFIEPTPLSPETALQEAEDTYAEATESADEFIETAAFTRGRGFTRKTAFLLHQATETLYAGLLLVLTGYSPKSHKLTNLRRLTEPLVAGLADAWPHETKLQRRSFELLRAAYVKGRYSKHFKITDEELAYLVERIGILRGLIDAACQKRLADLRDQAGQSV
ncbi:MAG: HEPN domain-containing protein [Brevundimonas aurantiaca]|uniref:HEPN domain-containing protein n=1 Tax=Brevundimonas TaxID=41275 RepID=UPI00098390B0|nr:MULTISPECIES: HEPN domain-containing protein [Brevundimonas]AQR60586.1 nucleotidyltransferase [Brevundimonas sp. LM2]MBK6024554.1 HEPN domain-containing protein [Brevundimonas nasdae]MDQ0451487.1 putative nucleotidyltransferase/HEPN domain-containing protein [Brevundimonas nasdae]